MKYILIKLIKLYQKIPGNFHYHCRYIPTCSDYAIESLERYGSIKGGYLTIKRILRCNPLGSYGYDPVPTTYKKRKKDKNAKD